MAHIFLSYSRKDTAVMQRVRDDLRAEGLEVWTDEGIEPGTPLWKDAIEQAIDAAGCAVVLLSPDSKDSIWVKRELDYAGAQNVRAFGLLVRGEEHNAVPFALIGAQYVDIRTDYAGGMRKLIPAIHNHLRSKGAVSPPAQPRRQQVQRPVSPEIPRRAPRTRTWRRWLISGVAVVLAAILVIIVLLVLQGRQVDTDGDGILDENDRCPTEHGLEAFDGCPSELVDRDRDGIPDEFDQCPEEGGPEEFEGCPPEVFDRDGDGVPEAFDRCPEIGGLEELEGCPSDEEMADDPDGDEIPNWDDLCPGEPGPPEFWGCPDPPPNADGDELPDEFDECPEEPGPAEHGGCP